MTQDRKTYYTKPKGEGEKAFTIYADAMNQIKEWKERHNAACTIPEWLPMFTPTSKYKFEFRESGIGNDIKIICDCGEKFSPEMNY